MKLPKPTAARGSMGIPHEIHPDTLRRQREESEATAEGGEADSAFSPDAMNLDDVEAPDDEDEAAEAAPAGADKPQTESPWGKFGHPLLNLKKIGVELTGEDFNRLIFKGYIEKTVVIAVNPITKEDITATMRTLTTGEYDELDECVAEECYNLKITNDGIASRRSAWTMAFAVTAIDGKPFVKPVMKKSDHGEVLDTKETARARKVYINQLYAETVNKLLGVYDTFTVNLRNVMGDPKKAFFEKP